MNDGPYCVWHPGPCDRLNCCMDGILPGEMPKCRPHQRGRDLVDALVIVFILLTTALVVVAFN